MPQLVWKQMRMEISPFMKRFYKKGVKVQVDHELISAERQGNQIKVSLRNTHTGKTITHITNNLVLEAGTLPNDESLLFNKRKVTQSRSCRYRSYGKWQTSTYFFWKRLPSLQGWRCC